MKIVWDEPKRVANLRQHGLDFADVEQHLEWDSAVYFETYPSRRTGRERLKALAAMNGTLVIAIFSPLGGEALALVSLRPASVRERKRYD